MTVRFSDKTLDTLCTDAFGSLWTERLLCYYRNFLQRRDATLSHPYASFFVNLMVAVRPSLSKITGTRSAEVFWNE